MVHATSFNLADSIQSGIRFVTSQPMAVIKAGGGLAILLSAIFVFLSYLLGDYALRFMLSIVFSGFDFGSFLMMILIALAWFAMTVAFVAYLALTYYRLAVGRDRTELVWQLGSADSPLVGIRSDESLIIKTALKRIVSLWPLVVAAILLALGQITGLYADFARFAGTEDASGAGFLSFILTVLGYLALVTGLWAITRVFLYLAPVIVQTGQADRQAVRAPIPGSFPGGMTSAPFLKSAGLVVVAYLPVWLINWLMGQIMSRTGGNIQAGAGNPFVLFLDSLVSLAAIILAMAFVGGALAHIWRDRATAAAFQSPTA